MLTKEIAEGRFARGEQLPSEHKLMARFGVCRETVRQALHDLCERGIVVARQGKGYFISRLTALHNLERLQSFGEMMAPLGVRTHSVLIEYIEMAAPREAAEALHLPPGEKVMRTVRTRLAGGTVVSLDVSFFPLEIGRRLVTLDLVHNDVFLLLENELGFELGYADLLIDLVPCRADYALLLGVEKDQPVIRIRRLSHDNSGRPIDYEHLFARQDAMQFKVRAARW